MQNETMWNVIRARGQKYPLCNMVEQLMMALSVSPTYVRQWCHSFYSGRSVDDRNWKVLFTHTGYRDKLPDRLSWVLINCDDLSEFVYRQCASKLDRKKNRRLLVQLTLASLARNCAIVS